MPQPPAFGYNDDPWVWDRKTAKRARKGGSNTARLNVDIDAYGNRKSRRSVDRSYREMMRQGIKPIVALSSSNEMGKKRLKRTAKKVAKRYDDARAIEIGNEPNLDIFGGMAAGKFAKRVKQAEKVIHRVDEDANVLAGAAAPVGNWEPYAKKVARKTRGRDIDLAAHIYPRMWGENPDKLDPPVKRAMRDYKKLEKMAGNRDVWVTETGFSKSEYGDRADELSAKLLKKLGNQGAKSVLFHRLKPGQSAGGTGQTLEDWESNISALDESGKPTDLYRALRRARRKQRR